MVPYYSLEVNRNIATIAEALHALDAPGNTNGRLKALMDPLECIIDLAMIHGFEGMEAIATRMQAGVRRALEKPSEDLPLFKTRMQRALEVMRRLLAQFDEGEAHRLVRESEHAMDYMIDSLQIEPPPADAEAPVAPPTESFEASTPPPSAEERDAPPADLPPRIEDYFDIREPEIPESSATSEDDFDHKVAALELDALAEAEPSTPVEPRPLPEEVLERVMALLLRLAAAVDYYYEEEDERPEAVLGIRETCADLSVVSAQLGDDEFHRVTGMMDQIARVCLDDEGESSVAVDTLARGGSELRSYLDAPQHQGIDLDATRCDLETFLYLNQKPIHPPAVNPAVLANLESGASPDDDEDEGVAAPKPPLLIRLKRWFGMD